MHCSFHSQSQAASPELTTAPIDDCCRSTRQLFYLITVRGARTRQRLYCCQSAITYKVRCYTLLPSDFVYCEMLCFTHISRIDLALLSFSKKNCSSLKGKTQRSAVGAPPTLTHSPHPLPLAEHIYLRASLSAFSLPVIRPRRAARHLWASSAATDRAIPKEWSTPRLEFGWTCALLTWLGSQRL